MKSNFRCIRLAVQVLVVAVSMVVFVSPVAFADDAYYLDGSITFGPQMLKDVEIAASDAAAVEVVNGGILYMNKSAVTHELISNTSVTGAVQVSAGSDVNLNDVQIATEGTLIDSGPPPTVASANGVYATGAGTIVTLKDVDIYCGTYAARGLYTTSGGTIIADLVNVETFKGGGGAAIATSGENGGNIKVRGGTFTTNGCCGSAAVFSTGSITVRDAVLTSLLAEGAVLDGPASISLANTSLSAAGNVGVAVIKSPLPDDGGSIPDGTSVFTMQGGELYSTDTLFYIPNAYAVIEISGVLASSDSGTLLTTAYSGGGPGNDPDRGSIVDFTANRQRLDGDIVCDAGASVSIALKDRSMLTGAVNSADSGAVVALALDETSGWHVTGDSYITVFSVAGAKPFHRRHGKGFPAADMHLANIRCDEGITVYYDPDVNEWLGGETYRLPGGGELAPW